MRRRYSIKRWIIPIVAVFMMVGGLAVFLYPALSNFLFEYEQRSAIASYKKQVAETDSNKLSEMASKAQEYNNALLELPSPLVSAQRDLTEDDDILDLGASGIIGYIDIEKLGLHLPIRHGTDEKTLQTAVGHLKGSSFPIGGQGTHSVLVAHNGLPSAKLFTDIDQLKKDDVFRVTVLAQVYDYRIDQILIVLPEEVEKELAILPGEDKITLMTCTPYGVNTHRLLVRGTRYLPETNEKMSGKVHSDSFWRGIIVMVLLSVTSAGVIFWFQKHKKEIH